MIRDDYHLETRELPIAEAQATGAITMAGEKYGELVRVVSAGPSVEFCGGTHAHSTGELGMFVLLSESSIGSGVRRIEAAVSRAAEAIVERTSDTVAQLAEALATKPDEVVERVARLQNDVRDLQKAFGELKARLAATDAQAYVERARDIGGRRVVGGARARSRRRGAARAGERDSGQAAAAASSRWSAPTARARRSS